MHSVNDYLNSPITDSTPLLALVLKKNHAWLITNKDYTLTTEEKNTLKPLIEQREQGVPFAYLSGVKGFYHLDFTVTPDTLIPRPETELLIDIALDLFKGKACKLLDLGTGSGIIAITLADKNPNWQVVATDFSKQAFKDWSNRVPETINSSIAPKTINTIEKPSPIIKPSNADLPQVFLLAKASALPKIAQLVTMSGTKIPSIKYKS
jgi:release factor glutamine methyltransferase